MITFKSGLTGTITLTEGFLTIEAALTLTGPGSESITVDGNGSKSVFYVYDTAIGNVVMSGLTITGAEGGSGIYALNDGDFTLTDVNVTGNNGAYGGGLYINNIGAFNLTNSNVSNNTSTDAAGGVYIYQDPTSVTITDTTIANNTTGGGGG
ncbi:MAG: right-handed parallel beta-helix repeat-containing protein, partial [Actinomycetes bacterium]